MHCEVFNNLNQFVMERSFTQGMDLLNITVSNLSAGTYRVVLMKDELILSNQLIEIQH